jgi:hypothetical protein
MGSEMKMNEPTLRDIKEARQRIQPFIHRTPRADVAHPR